MTEDIEIEGVLQTLAELADTYRMGVVTTSKRTDFALIHERRSILGLYGILFDSWRITSELNHIPNPI